MHMPAVVGGQPTLDPRMFVSGVVVHHDVDIELLRHILIDVLEKLQILLVTVPAFALTTSSSLSNNPLTKATMFVPPNPFGAFWVHVSRNRASGAVRIGPAMPIFMFEQQEKKNHDNFCSYQANSLPV